MAYNFLRGDRDQPFLLPPDLRDWLPADHLAWFVRDVVDQLDLDPFYRPYRTDGHGHPAYDPKTLLGVLLYGYCIGVRSSRQIERRCTEDLAFRVLAGNQIPDHVTIARFRVRHEQALAGFLVASLKLCAAAGLVRLGVVALDGTKVAGNAADKRQRRYETRVAELAAAARARGKPPRAHVKPRPRDEVPNPKAVANTTDPDSRFLRTRTGTVQGYNAQAVATEHQIVVAAALTQQANDVQQLHPMLGAVEQTLAAAQINARPGTVLADSGYWSIANLTTIPDAPELLVWPAKTGRSGKPRNDGQPSESKSEGLRAAMIAKLRSEKGKACYAKRKQTVEPVFGQLKEQQAARRFSRRGLAACEAEWQLLCGTHNLLKLWRHTRRPAPATAIT